NATKEELPTTTTKKQQQPPIGTKEELPTTTTTTKKQQQQPPIIVQPKTSNQIPTTPTFLSNNISKNTADSVRDKINLAFEKLSVERSVTNSVVIKGDIKNNSTQDLQEVKVFAEYYDKTGTLLAKIDHFITSPSSILKPTEQVSFDILEVLGFGFHKLGDYNIVASGETIN
ncbi:MAG: FxLYD domain-containing protein, partial [Nitrososphaeraceae archaeon]